MERQRQEKEEERRAASHGEKALLCAAVASLFSVLTDACAQPLDEWPPRWISYRQTHKRKRDATNNTAACAAAERKKKSKKAPSSPLPTTVTIPPPSAASLQTTGRQGLGTDWELTCNFRRSSQWVGAAKKEKEMEKTADIMESKEEEARRQPCFAAKVYTYFPPFCFICSLFFPSLSFIFVCLREKLWAPSEGAWEDDSRFFLRRGPQRDYWRCDGFSIWCLCCFLRCCCSGPPGANHIKPGSPRREALLNGCGAAIAI